VFPEFNITWREYTGKPDDLFKKYEKLHRITVAVDGRAPARHEFYVTDYESRQGGVEVDPEAIVLCKVVAPGLYKFYQPEDWKKGTKLFIPYSRIIYIEDPEEGEGENKYYLGMMDRRLMYGNMVWKLLEERDEIEERFKEYYERYKKLHVIAVDRKREIFYVTDYRAREGGVEIDPEAIVLWRDGKDYYYPTEWKEGAKLFIPYARIYCIEDPEEGGKKILYIIIAVALGLLPLLKR